MSTFLSARIDEATNDQLIAIANNESLTKTAIVKQALNLYLEKRKDKLTHQMQVLHQIESLKTDIGVVNGL